jgi:hypothetical protein
MAALNFATDTTGSCSCPKVLLIYDMGQTALLPLRIFITLKNPSPSAGIEPANLRSTTSPPRATFSCYIKTENLIVLPLAISYELIDGFSLNLVRTLQYEKLFHKNTFKNSFHCQHKIKFVRNSEVGRTLTAKNTSVVQLCTAAEIKTTCNLCSGYFTTE